MSAAGMCSLLSSLLRALWTVDVYLMLGTPMDHPYRIINIPDLDWVLYNSFEIEKANWER
jgi:hypothetical protein